MVQFVLCFKSLQHGQIFLVSPFSENGFACTCRTIRKKLLGTSELILLSIATSLLSETACLFLLRKSANPITGKSLTSLHYTKVTWLKSGFKEVAWKGKTGS